MLMLAPMYPMPFDNGTLDRVYNTLFHLSKWNKITLITFTNATHNPERNPFTHLNIDVISVPMRDKTKLNVILKSMWQKKTYETVQFESIDITDKILSAVVKADYDLSYCHHWAMSQYEAYLPGIKVLDTHNEMLTWWESFSLNDPNIFVKIYSKYMLSIQKAHDSHRLLGFDSCISVSNWDQARTKEYSPCKTSWHIAPNGVDIDYFCPDRIESDENNILFCGSLGGRMNEDAVTYFYEMIFPIILSDVKDVKFWIVGGKPSRRIRSLDKHPNIIVTGYVDDVRNFYNKASVVIAPFRLGGGTKLKILHAMSMGKAIISTSIGCQGISVSQSKNILVSDTPDDFARSVIRLLKDKQLRNKIGSEARSFVKDYYQWENICEDLQQFLINLKKR